MCQLQNNISKEKKKGFVSFVVQKQSCIKCIVLITRRSVRSGSQMLDSRNRSIFVTTLIAGANFLATAGDCFAAESARIDTGNTRKQRFSVKSAELTKQPQDSLTLTEIDTSGALAAAMNKQSTRESDNAK